MGIFSKIGKAFSLPGGAAAHSAGASEHQAGEQLRKDLESLNKDGRLHARYMLQNDALASLRLESGLIGTIKDVSYGGLAVRFQSPTGGLPTNLPESLTASLTVLDQTVDCRLSPVRVVHQNAQTMFAGFSLHHDTPATLLFLREVIEPLRCGQTLVAFAAEMRNDRFKGAEWTCLRGDGPTDVILRTDGAGALLEALVTFRNQGQYCDLSLKDGQLRTGRSLATDAKGASNAPGVQMAATAELDRTILRHAIYLLAAGPAPSQKIAHPLMSLVFAALRSNGKSAA